MLAERSMDIDTFAYIVSHDIKGPLSGIDSLVGFIVEDYSDRLDEEGREQLRLVQKMATRGVAMVDALRDFSRVARAELKALTVEPRNLVAQAMSAVDGRVVSPDVRLDIVTSLPVVSGDPDLLRALFERLLTNALMYNDKAIRHIQIGHRDEAPDGTVPVDAVLLYVTDNGIGIPEKHRRAVFDMFQRLHGPDAFGGGVGAGLAIAHKIVDRHGGTMWVESVESEGSTFCFTLPRPAAVSETARAAGAVQR